MECSWIFLLFSWVLAAEFLSLCWIFLLCCFRLGWVVTYENPSGLLLCPVDERVFKGPQDTFLNMGTHFYLRKDIFERGPNGRPSPSKSWAPLLSNPQKQHGRRKHMTNAGSWRGQPQVNLCQSTFLIYYPHRGNNTATKCLQYKITQGLTCHKIQPIIHTYATNLNRLVTVFLILF